MGNPFEMKKIVVFTCLLALVLHTPARAQNYHAVEGSPFAGSLGVANNPASILSTPYPWDITVFSFQLKNSTNAVVIHNFSLISSPDSSKYQFTQGNHTRYFNFNFNVHLLNARIALNRHAAIAFGANLRGYGIGKSSAFGYNDTLHNLTEFFNINNGNLPFSANVVSSTWIELFATYSKTIRDDETGRLNLGFTLKAMRGISGGFAQLTGGSVQSVPFGNQIAYTLNGGAAKYGYSSNYDTWQSSRSTGQNLNQFLGNSRGGAGDRPGRRILCKDPGHKGLRHDDDDYYDYTIGRSGFQPASTLAKTNINTGTQSASGYF